MIMYKRDIRYTHNDGYAQLIRQTTGRDSRGKPLPPTNEVVADLAYKIMTIRTTDYDFYQSDGVRLDKKIRTHTAPYYTDGDVTAYKLLLGGTLYAIINADIDNHNQLTYLYLQSVGKGGA